MKNSISRFHRKGKTNQPTRVSDNLKTSRPEVPGTGMHLLLENNSMNAFTSFDQERQHQLFFTYVLQQNWVLAEGLLDKKV